MDVQILLYSPRISNRLLYTLDLFALRFPGTSFLTTSDANKYRNAATPRINYSDFPIASPELHIQPAGLLTQTGTKPVGLFFLERMEQSVGKDPIPGDLLSFIFYMVSRYEEYNLSSDRLDACGRFPASQSLAARWGILQRPVADEWIEGIGRALESLFPTLRLERRRYTFLPTYDIDSAWRFLHKGFWRNLAGGANDLFRGRPEELKRRIDTLSDRSPDPDHTFDLIFDLSARYTLSPVFFWLLADVKRPYDTNISVDRPAFRSLVREVARQNQTGAHPSYQSNADPVVLKKEIERLCELTGAGRAAGFAPVRSRQHFLKLRFPATYRRLIEAGVREDYTMGYADDLGFRAGTATPFCWYDLEREEKTALRVFPFQIMDVTLNKYLALSPEEAVHRAGLLIESVKAVDGVFCTLWHNGSLSETEEWKNWRQVYQKIIQMAEKP